MQTMSDSAAASSIHMTATFEESAFCDECCAALSPVPMTSMAVALVALAHHAVYVHGFATGHAHAIALSDDQQKMFVEYRQGAAPRTGYGAPTLGLRNGQWVYLNGMTSALPPAESETDRNP
jgi:hypothetical protein